MDRPAIDAGRIGIRWLGAAGFELRTSGRTLLIDPFLTRAPLMTVALGRLESDPIVERLEADLILVGHSHYDHLLDAPRISARTGASIIGSADACLVAASLDRKSTCIRAPIARPFFHRGFELTAIPSAHGETLIGVPIDGANTPLRSAPHLLEMKKGEVYTWIIRAAGKTIVHASTAGLPHDPMAFAEHAPEGADVLLIALALRDNSPGYTRHLIDMLRPRVIIPHHGGLETDQLDEEIEEDFIEFAAQEGPRVRIARPFETLLF